MGHFIDGQWHSGWFAADSTGEFVRPDTSFRDALDAQRLQDGDYQLYVSFACPWAHRTLIARAVLGLESVLPVAVVDWLLEDHGWAFKPDRDGCTPDPLFGAQLLSELYLKADEKFTGRITVPVVWSRSQGTIVNNESRQVLRGLSSLARDRYDLSPETLRPQIDQAMDAIYKPINNGVYRAGFAASQGAYDQAVRDVFEALEHWENVLAQQPFLVGNVFTEADIAMFTTLLRFDPVYHTHFKCSRRRLSDSPELSGYLRSIYGLPGVAETCNMHHIRHHYYESHRHINPTGIVATLPEGDLEAPHDRWQRWPGAVRPG